MTEALNRGPHPPESTPDVIAELKQEEKEEVAKNQCRMIPWEEVKDNPPSQLKISLVSEILDLSFKL